MNTAGNKRQNSEMDEEKSSQQPRQDQPPRSGRSPEHHDQPAETDLSAPESAAKASSRPGPGEGRAPDPGEGETAAEETPAALQQRVQALEQENEELKNRLLRLQADFDNYRKRQRVEKEDLVLHANLDLIQRLLPVIDNLDRACSAGGDNTESVVKGIQMINRQLKEILQKEGLQPIECQGEPFDPHCHEAVMVEKSSAYPPNTVLEELQKGYRMRDKVLRPSTVKVSGE